MEKRDSSSTESSAKAPSKGAPTGSEPATSVDRPAQVMRDLESFSSISTDAEAVLLRCALARPVLRGTSHESGLREIEERARRQSDQDQKLDRFLDQIQLVMRADSSFQRRGEVKVMLGSALKNAGSRSAKVEKVIVDYEKSFNDAAQKGADFIRADAERLAAQQKFSEALAKLDEYPASFGGTRHAEALKALREELEGKGGKPKEPVPKKPPAGNVEVYRKRWEQAVLLAGAKRFDDAIAHLGQAEKSAEEKNAGAEIAQDMDLVRSAMTAHNEAIKVLVQWPRLAPLTVTYAEEGGTFVTANDRVRWTDAYHAELGTGDEVWFIEFRDIVAESLADIYLRSRADASAEDRRAAALLCLMEGADEAALLRLGAPSDRIPTKYWSFAGFARERALRRDPREFEARRLYYAAEKDWRNLATLGPAIDKYKILRSECAATDIVRRYQNTIVKRSQGGKEYFFAAADLAVGGGFRLVSHPKIQHCWQMEAVDPAKSGTAIASYVELEFYALPDTEYKCWVEVGACCQETFSFHYQATGLQGPNPTKPSESIACEPGGTGTIPVKHGIAFLKKLHLQHGGPKEPARWEWAPVPLPKFALQGPKKVRLISQHQGFSVGYAVVSAQRRSPPLEAEIFESRKTPPNSVQALGGRPLIRTSTVGGAGGTQFEDLPKTPSLLVGFKYSLAPTGTGSTIIKTLQPLYLTGTTRTEGKVYGTPSEAPQEAVARAGYAVGAIVAKGAVRMDGFKVVFMKITGTSLEPRDSYECAWIGGTGGGPETKLGGDGAPVVGIHGRSGMDLDGVGLIQLTPAEEPDSARATQGMIDLLSLIDPKRDAVAGEWKLDGPVLVCSKDIPCARIQVPYVPPAEYDLTIMLQKQGNDGVGIGLSSARTQFAALLDCWPQSGYRSGLEMLDGAFANANDSTRSGRVVANDRNAVVLCSVREGRVRVLADGVTVVDWKGDVSRLSVPPALVVPESRGLFLASWARCRITRIALLPVSGEGKRLRQP